MTLDLSLGETGRILSACAEAGLTTPQKAYVLATAYWETNRTMCPVEEAYYLGDRAASYRAKLSYAPWYGRGFVQLTWRDNYERAGRELGIELLADPELALDPDNAAQILVRGMVAGWFTGKKLSDYIRGPKADFVNARRIINRLDCADQISDLADGYLDVLTPVPAFPCLRRGMAGAGVSKLQAYLLALGQDLGSWGADGKFGAITERAVCAVQRAAGLKATGVVGPDTWATILN